MLTCQHCHKEFKKPWFQHPSLCPECRERVLGAYDNLSRFTMPRTTEEKQRDTSSDMLTGIVIGSALGRMEPPTYQSGGNFVSGGGGYGGGGASASWEPGNEPNVDPPPSVETTPCDPSPSYESPSAPCDTPSFDSGSSGGFDSGSGGGGSDVNF
jgi:hypothetical protein